MVKPTRIDFKAQSEAGKRYYARWKALQANGGEMIGVTVNRLAHPEQWQAWRKYYKAHGLWAMLELMDDGRVAKTMPTLDPLDFEPLMFVEVSPDNRVKDD
jgi:hypothetical protein